MKDDEILIKVKNTDEFITELNFLLENVKDVLNELAEKRDIISNIEKIDDLQEQIQEFKHLTKKMLEAKNDIEFMLSATNQSADITIKAINDFKDTYINLKEKIQREAEKANEFIEKSYNKVLKQLKNRLKYNIDELLELTKAISAEIEQIYEQDYYADVAKLKNKITFNNILMFIIIIFLAFSTYNFNKKITEIQNISYYNYSILHKITNSNN